MRCDFLPLAFAVVRRATRATIDDMLNVDSWCLARSSGCPVGLAWEEAHEREPGLDLWDSDGKHPNLGGLLSSGVCLLRDAVRQEPLRE